MLVFMSERKRRAAPETNNRGVERRRHFRVKRGGRRSKTFLLPSIHRHHQPTPLWSWHHNMPKYLTDVLARSGGGPFFYQMLLCWLRVKSGRGRRHQASSFLRLLLLHQRTGWISSSCCCCGERPKINDRQTRAFRGVEVCEHSQEDLFVCVSLARKEKKSHGLTMCCCVRVPPLSLMSTSTHAFSTPTQPNSQA
jgi:hypothetical protein